MLGRFEVEFKYCDKEDWIALFLTCKRLYSKCQALAVKQHIWTCTNLALLPHRLHSHVAQMRDPSCAMMLSCVNTTRIDFLDQLLTLPKLPKLTKLRDLRLTQRYAPVRLPCVEQLKLRRFNQEITPNWLPDSITSLTMVDFNQPLSNLPIHLQRLYLLEFNQPIRVGDLPSTLTDLTLSTFNHPIDPAALPRLSRLSLPWFNHILAPGVLPTTLDTLALWHFDHSISVNILPPALSILYLGDFNQPLLAGVLPHTLIKLVFGKFNQPLVAGVLPPSLTQLAFHEFNQPITHPLPSRLTALVFENFNQRCSFQTLVHLRELRLPDGFNQPIVLPSFNLTFGKRKRYA